jgi:predicted HTH domain antitoxin
MTIHFDIPASVERALGSQGREPAAELKEAALVELYRMGRISHALLAEALGVSRLETDAVLKRHGVTEDTPTLEELDAQVARLRSLGR